MNKNRTVPKIWDLIETNSLSYIKGRDSQDFDTTPAQYNTGIYDLRDFNGFEFSTVIAMGRDRYAKTQIVFPYQYNQKSEMYFRTSNSTGWREGFCKVWHDKNLDPSNFVEKDKPSVNGNIIMNGRVVLGADNIGLDDERFFIHFTDPGTISSFYKDGRLVLRATNLETRNKFLVPAINEIKNTFENPSTLYTNSSGNPVGSFVATGLSNYRIINIKYRVAKNEDHSMLNGPDITQMLVYLDGENNYFHLWSNGDRVRYEIQGDKIVREFSQGNNPNLISITKIYGIVKK
ncbi:hypothetical protein [Fusobacterium hominis]|uniref:hypothetical protein n=1 Tax=Fusobacterium hominis TaxID=2764326 RepID=UPI0022E17BBD|nr:hypothetical protein [Fusobacterium hominis]